MKTTKTIHYEFDYVRTLEQSIVHYKLGELYSKNHLKRIKDFSWLKQRLSNSYNVFFVKRQNSLVFKL